MIILNLKIFLNNGDGFDDINRKILSYLSIKAITNLLDVSTKINNKVIYYLPNIIEEILKNDNCKFLIIKLLEIYDIKNNHMKIIEMLINHNNLFIESNHNNLFIESDVYLEIYEIISIRPRSNLTNTIIKNFFDIIPNDYNYRGEFTCYIFTYDESGKFFNIILNIIEIIYDKKLYHFVDTLIRFYKKESDEYTKSYSRLSYENKKQLYYLISKFELFRAVDKMIRLDENQHSLILENIKNNIKLL